MTWMVSHHSYSNSKPSSCGWWNRSALHHILRHFTAHKTSGYLPWLEATKDARRQLLLQLLHCCASWFHPCCTSVCFWSCEIHEVSDLKFGNRVWHISWQLKMGVSQFYGHIGNSWLLVTACWPYSLGWGRRPNGHRNSGRQLARPQSEIFQLRQLVGGDWNHGILWLSIYWE